MSCITFFSNFFSFRVPFPFPHFLRITAEVASAEVTCVDHGPAMMVSLCPCCASSALGPHCHPPSTGTFLPAKMEQRWDSSRYCGHYLAPALGARGHNVGLWARSCGSDGYSLTAALETSQITFRKIFSCHSRVFGIKYTLVLLYPHPYLIFMAILLA